MITSDIIQALRDAGYSNGWIVNGDEITLWQDATNEEAVVKLGLPDHVKTDAPNPDAARDSA
jgi:hypothetical protein